MTIGLSTSHIWNPLSALIRWWFNVEYSHVYLKWETPWGFNEILEASKDSLHMIEESKWSLKNKVIKEYTFEVTQHQFNRVMREIRRDTGTRYGRTQLVGMIIMEVFRLRDNPFADGGRSLVCSDVALRFLRILGFNIYKLREDKVTPKDIENILEGAQ